MNARHKKVVYVLGGCSLLLVWRVYAVLTNYFPAAAQATVTPVEEVAPPVALDQPDPMAGVWAKQHQLEERPWGHNPFIAPEDIVLEEQPANPDVSPEKAPAAPRLTLTGISRVGDAYRAIVHSGIVTVGDPVDSGFVVRNIESSSVTLAAGPWLYTYELGSDKPTVRRLGKTP